MKKKSERTRKPAWPKIRQRRFSWQDKRGRKRVGKSWQVDCGVVNGKRVTRSFKKKADAETWAGQKRSEKERRGVGAFDLTDKQRLDASDALQTLDGTSTLAVAAEFYMQHHNPAGGTRTVAQLLTEYVEAKTRANLRESSLTDIRYRIGKFAETFGTRGTQTITTNDIEKWLDQGTYSGVSRLNFRRALIGFFNYAKRRGVIAINPATAVERPKLDEKLPGILSATEVDTFMRAASNHADEIVPALAIGFFAGLRTSELMQLDWRNIDLEEHLITVTPETAKKRRQRHVDISDNLLQWLAACTNRTGPVSPSPGRFRSLQAKVKTKANLGPWPSNAMRHTYASHHLAFHQNAAQTALQLGHRDTGVLYDHYRNLVKPAAAKKYWSIRPKKDSKILQMGAAS